MPAEIQNSGCDVRIQSRGDPFVICLTHNVKEWINTPAEAWAWEQEHRRSVAAEGEIPRVGTLVEPNV